VKKFLIPLLVMLALLTLVINACGTSTTTTVAAPDTTTAPAATTSKPTSSATVPATTTAVPTSVAAIAQPKSGGTLRFVTTTGPYASFGWPVDSLGPAGVMVMTPYAETLVREMVDGKFQPWLATDWSLASDGLSYTFNLRKGVKFHDGTDFDAAAVKYCLDAVITAKSSPAINWASIDVIDTSTVRLNLKKFDNSILTGLTAQQCFIVSPTNVQKNGLDYARKNPVGTGPFKFAGFSLDEYAKYVKFDGYWQKGKPYLNGFQYLFIKDPLTQQMTLKSGGAEILGLLDGSVLADLQKVGFVSAAFASGTDYLTPDTKNPDSLFSNIKVRQALEYAIDKETIVKGLGYGFWYANDQLPPPQHAFHATLSNSPTYDAKKAKQLLVEAGYPNGFKIWMSPPRASYKDETQAVAGYLGQVGIQVDAQIIDNTKFFDYSQGGWKGGLLIQGAGMSPNFAYSFNSLMGPNSIYNKSVNVPQSILDLTLQALVAKDYATQLDLNKKLAQAIAADETVICLLSSARGFAVNPIIHDAGLMTGGSWTGWYPENTWMDTAK
jgi:ABC-type transport system substrate-binding protein